MDTPNQTQPQIQQTVVVIGKQKSVGVAFLLAFLFGPLGLLYASVTGGIVMFLIGIVIGIVTFGIGLIFVWIGCIIWAVIAAGNANKRMTAGAGLHINTSFSGQQPIQQSQPPTQQIHQQTEAQPIPESQPQPRILETSKQEHQPLYQPTSTIAKPSFDLAQWFDKNKKAVFIGGGGIVGLLLIVLAMKFVFSIDFSKKQTRDTEVSQQLNTPISNSQNNSSNQSTNTTFEREIPKPLVPIVGASNVLPTWTQREDVEGNYPLLTGLYVGAIGKKPFKLVISNVDTINNTLSGYSETSTSQTAFEGRYTMTIREPNSRVADNVIDFQTWVFKAVLFEPSGVNHAGVFQISFNVTDANGSDAFGSWISYDGRLYREVKLLDTYTAQEQ